MLIESLFPELAQSGYRITSPATLVYNCIAWAAGDDQKWWEPLAGPGYYWPEKVPREYTIEALIGVVESLGYARCDDSSLETGYEKLALYGNNEGYTHIARQMQNSMWTSKLGALEDIEHNSLEVLQGKEYGSLVQILRRLKSA